MEVTVLSVIRKGAQEA